MRKRKIYRRNQRGVALLFALGVLSLLLIMGLAFVANSLLSQKVASNNSSRSQAKMLAQSAISRMAISLMYYQYNAANPPPGATYSGFIPTNFMDVRSCYDLVADGALAPNSSDLAATDGLRNADSKLIVSDIWLSNYDLASDLRGEWSYITAEDADGEDRLVGRIAYQLIPSSTTAQINIGHALSGIFLQGDPERVPWQTRIGTDINELNLDSSEVLSGWGTHPNTPSEDEMTDVLFDTLFTSCADPWFSDENRKNWIKHWFVDGEVDADPEYYLFDPSGQSAQYFHRFNLGELDSGAGTIDDKWYDRFDGLSLDGRNYKDVVEKLAGDSIEFRITDEWTPAGVGLPFLKFIGESRGSFENLRDRRRQITANLNDYCDSDSIPTSDIRAEEWKTNLDTAEPANFWPKYTGNEKTPYINEFALGFNIEPSVDGANTSSMKVKATVTAELAAELISIYEKEPTDPYTLYMNLPAEDFKLKLAMEAKVSVQEPEAAETIITIPEKIVELTLSTGSEGSPLSNIREIKFEPTDWEGKGGYALKHLELTLENAEAVWDLSGEISATAEATVKLTDIRFSIKADSSFKVGGIVLTRQETVDSVTTEYGVDFVRWNDSFPVLDSDFQLFKQADLGYRTDGEHAGYNEVTGGTFTVADAKYRKFYLAGMQARDPRQNLNVKPNLNDGSDSFDENNSDWRTFSDINWIVYNTEENPYDKGLLSMEIKFNEDTVGSSFVQGLVNGVSNPSDREKKTESDGITETVVGDNEEVADPAWSDDDSDHHLSTAYIRNAPMKSLWELGAIHRAKAWQTINLKTAMRPGAETEPIRNEDMRQPGEGDSTWEESGTSFAAGDGGLLEQVKITDNAYCYGKLNVNMLSNDSTVNPDYTTWDDDMGIALFYNIYRGQEIGDLFVGDAESFPTTGTPILWTEGVADPMRQAVVSFRSRYGFRYNNAFESRAQFLAWETDDDKSLANGFGIISLTEYDNLPDAQREEIVGKTINLLKGANTVSNMIRFIVVAQTIRDMDGTVARIRYDGNVETRDCEYGTFDVDDDGSAFPADFPENDRLLYFDEITGEVKLLVTMENNPSSGQIIVRQIEYIE